jgi:hypothetical protein
MREKVTDSWRENERANKAHTTFGLKAKSAQAPGFRGHGLAVTAGRGAAAIALVGATVKMVRDGLGGVGDFSWLAAQRRKTTVPVVPEYVPSNKHSNR